jgi:DNA-directed RNA polymerase subunit RPC12/RpoP
MTPTSEKGSKPPARCKDCGGRLIVTKCGTTHVSVQALIKCQQKAGR